MINKFVLSIIVMIITLFASGGMVTFGQMNIKGDSEFVIEEIDLKCGESKDAVIQKLGPPNWQGSGVNVIRYYDLISKLIVSLEFDQNNQLIRVMIHKSGVFPESPVKQ